MRLIIVLLTAGVTLFGCESKVNGPAVENEDSTEVSHDLVVPSGDPPELVMVNEESLMESLTTNGAHITVLNVWATWCGPCHVEMPAFVQYASDAPEDVAVRFLSVDDKGLDERILDFLTEYGVSDVSYYSEAGDAIVRQIHPNWTYGVPLTLIFNSEGLIADAWEGAVTYDFLEAKVVRARRIIDEAAQGESENPEVEQS